MVAEGNLIFLHNNSVIADGRELAFQRSLRFWKVQKHFP